MTPQRNGFAGAVGRFFFAPTDPTTLGFIRIMAGLLLLYTHAAYSTDLKAFFGPDAWWGQASGNAQRRETPFVTSPLGWSEFTPNIRLDEVPHRRKAEIDFMRRLPSTTDERRHALEYLRLIYAGTREDVSFGLNLSNSASRLTDDNQDMAVRNALRQEQIPDRTGPISAFPPFMYRETPENRILVWDALLRFNKLLPAGQEEQEFVLGWFAGYVNHEVPQRKAVYDFLVGDKVDANGRQQGLPADAAERDEVLDYLDMWSADPRQISSRGTPVWSQWYHLTDGTTMWIVHVCCLVIFLLFTLGLWTRTTSALAWAASLTYIHRGQISLFGQDTMQTILITYLMIAPSGAALSIDALRKRFRAAKVTLAGGHAAWAEQALAGPASSWLANLGIRLLQINYCLVYLSSGISKLKGATWWEHLAAWLVMANPEFGLVRYEAYEWVLRQAAEWRFGMAAMAATVTVYTLVVEIGFPMMVWTRVRPFIVSASILLHLGIAIIMGLSMFGMAMFSMVLAFFPSKLIRDRIAVTPGSGPKLRMTYDARDAAAVRTAARVKMLDLAGQVTFTNVPDAPPALTDSAGVKHEGKAIRSAALKSLVLLKPVSWLPL